VVGEEGVMASVLSRSPGRPPNILLITSDEERYALPKLDRFVSPARDDFKMALAR
jgi:hypothetical protein